FSRPNRKADRDFLSTLGSAGIIVASIAIACSASFSSWMGPYDEGLALTNALRILAGDVPYRDYWTTYPPGTSFVLAAAFRLSEPTVLVARIVNALWVVAIALCIHSVVLRIHPRIISAVVAFALTLLLVLSLPPSYSAIPALALCLGAALVLDESLRRE